MQKNEIYELVIESMTAEGQGIGRVDGMAVFVPGTAVGDRITVRIVKPLKRYAFGRMEALLTPSETRIQPDCQVCAQCGGCVYRHLRYDEERRIKRGLVDDCLKRIGGLDVQTEGILSVTDDNGYVTNGYRNKAQYPFTVDRDGHIRVGFFATHSHRVVANDTCPLSPAVFDRAAACVCRFLEQHRLTVYDEQAHRGLARHLYLRYAESTGRVMVCLVINGKSLPDSEAFVEAVRAAVPEVSGILLSINRERTNVVLGKQFVTLWGDPWLEDRLCGLRFRLDPAAFYQVNRRGAELLYTKAAEYAGLKAGDLLLDLYCGAGTIGLSMSAVNGGLGRLIGVEIVPQAVENARQNAERNGVTNAEFICGDAGQAAERLAAQGLKPDVVVVDPPRKGCDEPTLQAIGRMSPERLVYVSCDPATLARDCARLRELGYTLLRACAVDLFPRTGHVETVVLLSHK